jgi:hypothetical protein
VTDATLIERKTHPAALDRLMAIDPACASAGI